MTGSNLNFEALAPPVVAWLLTYAIHRTLLLGLAWLVARYARSQRLKDLLENQSLDVFAGLRAKETGVLL